VKDGFQFYNTFFNAPPAIKVCYIDLYKAPQASQNVGAVARHVCGRDSWAGLEAAQVERKCGVLRRNESR